jgi:hypothetical protein
VRQQELYATKMEGEHRARRKANALASKKVFSLFKQIDVDGSGDLDKSELKVVAEQLGLEISDKELDTMLKQMDENDDGAISPEEFETWWQVNLMAETIAEAIDEDNEGHVMLEELELLFEQVNSLVLKMGAVTKVVDPQEVALSLCTNAGNGEFIPVEALAIELLNVYGCDKKAFHEIEGMVNELPEPLSRGIPAVYCGAMRLLQAMDTCETEIGAIVKKEAEWREGQATSTFKLEGNTDEDGREIKLDLTRICTTLIAQHGRRGVVQLLTSANTGRLGKICTSVQEKQENVLYAAHMGWDYIKVAVEEVHSLVGFFKAAPKEYVNYCRDSVLGMRDTGANLVAAVGVTPALTGPDSIETKPEDKVVGRDNLLVDVCRAVATDGSCVLCHGRPGMGKTTILKECHRRLRDNFEYCCYINALTEVSLYEGLLHFAQNNIDVVPSDATLNSGVVKSVKEFLAETEDWLFIIDNASHPSMIMELLPTSLGHVLMADDTIASWTDYIDPEPPTEVAIEWLKQNPDRLSDFNAKYGPNAGEQILAPASTDQELDPAADLGPEPEPEPEPEPTLRRVTLDVKVKEFSTETSVELLTTIIPKAMKEQLEHPNLSELLEDSINNSPLCVSLVGKLMTAGLPLDSIWDAFATPEIVEQAETGLVISEADRPQPGVYRVTVSTGLIRGAGTDANVFIQLIGRVDGVEAQSLVTPLNGENAVKSEKSHMNKFEHGHKDEFQLTVGEPLGDIFQIRIAQDGSGLAPDWYVTSISVAHEATGERWVFIDGGWLRTADLVDRKYRCVKKISTTCDSHPTSDKNGELKKGDTMIVSKEPIRVPLNNAGKQSQPRIQFLRGVTIRWADVTDSKGRPILENDGPTLVQTNDVDHGTMLVREMSVRDESAGTMTEYAIEFNTSDIPMAGTDAEVYVNIIGSKGDTGEIHIESVRSDFERGDINTFNVYARDVGKVKKLKVWHDGKKLGAGWHLASAAVTNKRSWKHWEFLCDEWLDVKKGDGSICRELITGAVDSDGAHGYEVIVKTGDMDGAGTDSNVYVDLLGSKGPSGARRLDHPKHDDFEEGAEDTYKINVSDLGRLENIRVWHDGKGFGAAWYLEWITVVDRLQWRRYHFPCDKWFDKKHKPPKFKDGDGQIDRVLLPDDTTADVIPYEIIVETGDTANAGTDANVRIKIFGSLAESDDLLLDEDGDEFERGNRDKFTLSIPELGEIKEIRLWHDNSGLGPGPFLPTSSLSRSQRVAYHKLTYLNRCPRSPL